jgi:DNA topoisomerase IA
MPPSPARSQRRLGASQQAHLQQRQGFGPLRHHPDRHDAKTLSEAEQKLYDLVTKRFLAIFFPAAEYNITTRITRVEGKPSRRKARCWSAGWLAIYGKEAQGDDEGPQLAPVQPKERVWANDVEVKANQTKPPARFTEATLLTAMEGAGKLIEEEELREAMSARGLGTPATRAATIEGSSRKNTCTATAASCSRRPRPSP